MTTIPESVRTANDVDAAFQQAADSLREAGAVDRLFDLRLLQAKVHLGLPVGRPESLADVPKEHRTAVEAAYREAAREAGQQLIESGDPVRAWSYFHAIGETDAVRSAFDAMPIRNGDHPDVDYEREQEIANICLFERAHPRKGVEMLLALVGTCSTITSLDQAFPQLSAADRAACADVMVRSLHADLVRSVTAHIEQKTPLLRPADSLSDLLSGRGELFEGANYHIDVSHLSSVVRFARSIEPPSETLALAVELCDYGRRLDSTLQYDAEPPFDTYYEANLHFLSALNAVGNDDSAPIEKAEAYFRKKLADEPDLPDQRLIAYVLTDLLVRCGQSAEAVALAGEFLADSADETGFSYAELCQTTDHLDQLVEYAESRGDLVSYLAGRFAKPITK